MTTPDQPSLKREIGFAGSAFLSFNGMVGAGIFALPETLYGQFGTFSPWLFPMFGVLVLLIAIPFARVASYFPATGGPVAYAGTFGPFASLQIGWLYFAARATAMAANANVLVTYLAAFWPPLGAGMGRAAAMLAIVALVTVINIVGVRRAIRLVDALTLLKAAPLIGMALYGLVLLGPPAMPAALPPIAEIEVAALLVLYAFVGFENSCVPAGETVDPKRVIPRALIVTIVATALLYFVVQLAYVAVMAPGAGGEAPMVAFGTVLAGAAGGLLLTAAAIFSLAGNISASMTSTPRTTFALAGERLLPAWFGRIGERYQTPRNSILFMGAFVAALAVTGSFVWLAVVSTLARLVIYAVSIAALPVLRRQAGAPPATGYILAAAGLIVCGWAAAQSEWPAWRMLIAIAIAGTLLYGVARLRPAPVRPE